jgi:Holliday junction DNA helicase RuvA
MYEYIKGTLIESTPSKAILETQGIGYSLLVPFNNFSKFPPLGSMVTLYVSFVVREDSQKLYGFLTQHERDLFENLLNVSGVGPKTSLSLVGHMEIHDLQTAISQGNTQLICKIPGIGKKTAERLVVDLRDKIKKGMYQSTETRLLSNITEEKGAVTDAISALINLGYNSSQAQKAIKAALDKTSGEPELAKLITAALRNI